MAHACPLPLPETHQKFEFIQVSLVVAELETWAVPKGALLWPGGATILVATASAHRCVPQELHPRWQPQWDTDL